MVDLASFRCKKWTLFTLCLLGIIVTLIVTILACIIVSNASPPAGSKEEVVTNWPEVQKVAKGIIAIGVITIIIEMLGLFGAYKEHFCMTLAYAILMTLATLGSLGLATQQASNWGNFVVNLLITIMAYLYARDLKQIERERQHAGHGYTA